MSDFGTEPTLPPPPAPYPPQATGIPPAYAPPGYAPYAAAAVPKPPRPPVPVGSWLLIGGAVVMIVGSALNWYTVAGTKLNGFEDTFDPDTGRVTTNTGGVFVLLAILALGFGIAQLAAKRVPAVAILAVVFATFGVLGVAGELANTSDRRHFVEGSATFSMGPGIYVVLLGALVALAGSIATLSRRRRWPTAG